MLLAHTVRTRKDALLIVKEAASIAKSLAAKLAVNVSKDREEPSSRSSFEGFLRYSAENLCGKVGG